MKVLGKLCFWLVLLNSLIIIGEALALLIGMNIPKKKLQLAYSKKRCISNL
ncbi:MAG: hypothetical protein BAJALOKI1v1_160026 [Promethearchaeota archaeon]|nr:MAG: hypothetical protein BAJALOKI1v1_160026 [Candidatus Lokiarchaeota archaeon]